MKLRIGIHTAGAAEIMTGADSVTIANAVMGAGFHWQRRFPLRLDRSANIIATDSPSVSSSQTRIGAIAELDIEDYLRSVVSSEMNPEAPKEFIKAHAIMARSWASRMKMHLNRKKGNNEFRCESGAGKRIVRIFDSSDHDGFDLCNDDHCQRFQGIGVVTEKAARAVEDTRGLVLTDAESRVADCRYSKCCGGRSERFSICWQDVDMDYLQPVNDPWCDPERLPEELRSALLKTVLKDYDRETASSYFRWRRFADSEGIQSRLREQYGEDIGEIKDIEPIARGDSGRISLLRLVGSEGSIEIGKELAVRMLLAPDCLLSSAFSIERSGSGFMLSGRGWGHGVGLCQIGAAGMALSGRTAEEILSFYFPNTRIAPLSTLNSHTPLN